MWQYMGISGSRFMQQIWLELHIFRGDKETLNNILITYLRRHLDNPFHDRDVVMPDVVRGLLESIQHGTRPIDWEPTASRNVSTKPIETADLRATFSVTIPLGDEDSVIITKVEQSSKGCIYNHTVTFDWSGNVLYENE